VINTNIAPILHRFQVMSDYWSNFRWCDPLPISRQMIYR